MLWVAPFAGAWIEILLQMFKSRKKIVAPFAGAWIEITDTSVAKVSKRSLPSRERGLKSIRQIQGLFRCAVAPFAGAWIEIYAI